MKKWILLVLIFSSLYAQPPPCYLFSISGEYVGVRKTHFTTPGFKDHSLRYRQWNIAYAYTYPVNRVWGVIFGAGWVGTEVNMENNPDFDEKIFDYVNLSLGAFTNSFPDWTWTFTFSLFLDTEELSLIDYALYQGILWGKYQLCETLEFDVGIITEIGLRKDKIWPIFGFAYLPEWTKWRLYAIYPIHIALEYPVSPCATFAASLRFLRNRHRVEKDEPNPQAIFEYRTWGGELDLTYAPYRWFSIKGFFGSAFDGDLEISDLNNKNDTHYKFKGSLYVGASALLSF